MQNNWSHQAQPNGYYNNAQGYYDPNYGQPQRPPPQPMASPGHPMGMMPQQQQPAYPQQQQYDNNYYQYPSYQQPQPPEPPQQTQQYYPQYQRQDYTPTSSHFHSPQPPQQSLPPQAQAQPLRHLSAQLSPQHLQQPQHQAQSLPQLSAQLSPQTLAHTTPQYQPQLSPQPLQQRGHYTPPFSPQAALQQRHLSHSPLSQPPLSQPPISQAHTQSPLSQPLSHPQSQQPLHQQPISQPLSQTISQQPRPSQSPLSQPPLTPRHINPQQLQQNYQYDLNTTIPQSVPQQPPRLPESNSFTHQQHQQPQQTQQNHQQHQQQPWHSPHQQQQQQQTQFHDPRPAPLPQVQTLEPKMLQRQPEYQLPPEPRAIVPPPVQVPEPKPQPQRQYHDALPSPQARTPVAKPKPAPQPKPVVAKVEKPKPKSSPQVQVQVQIPIQKAQSPAVPKPPVAVKKQESPVVSKPTIPPPAPVKQRSPSVPVTTAPPPAPVKAAPEPPKPKPKKTPASEHPGLLLTLAEEFIAAAQKLSDPQTVAMGGGQSDRYYSLMATGLGCFEAALNNFNLHPREEARLRLRYATLLHEETENAMEAEEVLGKGIPLCERNRLIDLKYSMQHLLARVTAKSNIKAAVKSIDKLLPDIETYKHFQWLYAFRFLRATLSMQSSAPAERNAASQHLQAVSSVAEREGEKAVYTFAMALQVIASIQTPGQEAIEQAQRFVASGRQHQLDPQMQGLQSLTLMLDFLDVFCSLRQFQNPEAANEKLSTLQTTLSQGSVDNDGKLLIPLTTVANDTEIADCSGIFVKDAAGHKALHFQWLTQEDIRGLSLWIDGLCSLYCKPGQEKCRQPLANGLEAVEKSLQTPNSTMSLSRASNRDGQLRRLRAWLQLHNCFALCCQSQWRAARKILDSFEKEAARSTPKPPRDVRDTATYLAAAISQAFGDGEPMITLYQKLVTDLPVTKATTPTRNDLITLSGINLVFYVRNNPTHHLYPNLETILSDLQPRCLAHANANIQAAYHLMRALCHGESDNASTANANVNLDIQAFASPTLGLGSLGGSDTDSGSSRSIIKTKRSLERALHLAKPTANFSLLSMTMCFMTTTFFTGLVGEQAEKAARTARALAKNSGSALWFCVADGLLEKTLGLLGNTEGADLHRAEAWKCAGQLPAELRRTCGMLAPDAQGSKKGVAGNTALIASATSASPVVGSAPPPPKQPQQQQSVSVVLPR